MYYRNWHWRHSFRMGGTLPDTRGLGVLSGQREGFRWNLQFSPVFK